MKTIFIKSSLLFLLLQFSATGLFAQSSPQLTNSHAVVRDAQGNPLPAEAVAHDNGLTQSKDIKSGTSVADMGVLMVADVKALNSKQQQTEVTIELLKKQIEILQKQNEVMKMVNEEQAKTNMLFQQQIDDLKKK